MSINTIKTVSLYCLFTLLLLTKQATAYAQDNISYDAGMHTIYYNVFNSSLIPAEVASTYSLTRAKNRVYLNVAIVKKSGGYGFAPKKISGFHRNLMQQKFPLEFIEIKEATATYYLAPIRFNNEEILHIDITVQADNDSPEHTFTITKKLYTD